MSLTIEWRIRPDSDTVLVVSDNQAVEVAIRADAMVLSKMLTTPGDLSLWTGGKILEAVDRDPATWGELVISRSEGGQILTMDPELFWNGVYEWFRARGIDYDIYLHSAHEK